jgi:hypothetical protein
MRQYGARSTVVAHNVWAVAVTDYRLTVSAPSLFGASMSLTVKVSDGRQVRT